MIVRGQNDIDTLTDNVACFKRLLSEFTSKAIDIYTQMNEYYERPPLPDKTMQSLLRHLTNTRFKIIECVTLVQRCTLDSSSIDLKGYKSMRTASSNKA